MTWPGEKQAWDILSELDPTDVKINAAVDFDSALSTYVLTCLGQQINISLSDRNISSNTELGKQLLNEFGDYSRLSILHYLIHAKNLPISGELVRPSDLPGGSIFISGTHVIPLEKIADRFGNNLDEFLMVGKTLAGTQLDYGDISFELFPFPLVPIVIIVWAGDEEFASRSSILLDSSCLVHMSTDIVWSTAMMTVEMMLANIYS